MWVFRGLEQLQRFTALLRPGVESTNTSKTLRLESNTSCKMDGEIPELHTTLRNGSDSPPLSKPRQCLSQGLEFSARAVHKAGGKLRVQWPVATS